VDGSESQKRFKARRDALPADHQATVFLLEPGKRALSLEARDNFLDRSAAIFLGLPDPLRDLCSNPTLAQGLP